jgi:hypothetical protein
LIDGQNDLKGLQANDFEQNYYMLNLEYSLMLIGKKFVAVLASFELDYKQQEILKS